MKLDQQAVLGLHVALLALLAVVVAGGSATRPKGRRATLAGIGLIAAATVVFFSLSDSHRLPTNLVTVFHEGTSAGNIRQVYGENVHAGRSFLVLTGLFSHQHVRDLRDVVRMNLWLGIVNTTVFVLIAWRVLGKASAAALFGLYFALNRNSLCASFSELPASILTSYFLLAVVAGESFNRALGASSKEAGLGLGLLALLTLATAWTRPEMAFIGVSGTALAIVRLLFGSSRVRRWGRALLDKILGIPMWTVWSKIALALILLMSVPHPFFPPATRKLLAGLHPLNPSFFTLPFFLLHYLPLGMVVLFVLGTVYALKRLDRFFLLPISLIVMYRTYHSAAFQVFYVLFRYITMLTPIVMFLALFGWRELESIAVRRRWPGGWRRVALALLTVLFLVPPVHGSREFFAGPHDMAGGRRVGALPDLFLNVWDFFSFPLSRNQQVEVRYLLDLRDRYPDCLFTSKVRKWPPTLGAQAHDLVLWGHPLDRVVTISGSKPPVADAVKRYAPGSGCVLFYRGLDCNVVGRDHCEKEITGLAQVDRKSFASRPYGDIEEYGEYEPVIRLDLHEVSRARKGP